MQVSDTTRTTKGFDHTHKTTSLQCKNCNQQFLANRKTAQFCSSSCRSQFWMTKNDKKIITLTVPADIDESYLEKIKDMLANYKPAGATHIEVPKPGNVKEKFSTETELRSFMSNLGYYDYKIPKHDTGIFYDQGLSITKHFDGWEVKIIG